jgi:hypothetical protein
MDTSAYSPNTATSILMEDHMDDDGMICSMTGNFYY